jgi:K+-sensing histidine kinase KdpD
VTGERVGVGSFLGAVGALFAAAALVSVRDHFAQVNVVLILVLFVLLGAVVGGRLAGAVAAVVASISYDFFHTQPYNSLKIDRAADIETTLLLLAVGLIIGEIVVRSDRIREALGSARGELRGLHRVARLAANGEAVDDVISAVSAELAATLGLSRCFYETAPFRSSYARLEQTGAMASSYRTTAWSCPSSSTTRSSDDSCSYRRPVTV